MAFGDKLIFEMFHLDTHLPAAHRNPVLGFAAALLSTDSYFGCAPRHRSDRNLVATDYNTESFSKLSPKYKMFF